MIDKELLKQCGWDDALIDAVNESAAPLREIAFQDDFSSSLEQQLIVSTSEFYSDSVIYNASSSFTVKHDRD